MIVVRSTTTITKLTTLWQGKKVKFSSITFLVLLSWLSVSFSVLSQEEGFAPGVEVNFLQDNNIYRTSDEISDTITSIAPTFAYNALYGKQVVSAIYNGDYAFYADNSDLNYLDHDISVKALLDHSYSLSSEFTANYQYLIEQPGTTNAVTSELSEFNQQSNTTFAAKVLFGAQQSKGQIVTAYAQSKLRYDNNEQQFRDYDNDKATGTFFYRVAPKTRILLEVSAADLNYKNNFIFDQSSKQKSYLAGVEWNATAITSSVFKIGYQDVDYANDLISDLSGLSYFLDMSWKPNTYSLVKIGASRAARESAEQSVGGFLSNEFNVGVDHEFTRKTKLSISYRYVESEFDDSQNRQEELQSFSMSIKYQSKRWLQLHLGCEVSKRESTSELFEFDASVINVGVVMSFD